MKHRPFGSFRVRLFVAFLAATLIPMLLCAGLLLQTFRVRLTSDAQQEAETFLNTALTSLDQLYGGFTRAAAAVGRDKTISGALSGSGTPDTVVNSRLFSATGELRAYARFDLYDSAGVWRYSTGNPPSERVLPTGWGVLGAAGRDGALSFVTAEEVTDTASPRLMGVSALTDEAGSPVGYFVISVYQNHLRSLLEGKYGVQNDLMLLSRYWRPVYCTQPSLAASLAPELRSRLLAGDDLGDSAGDFVCSVAPHQGLGLYVALRQPQVFNRETMRLSYTLSATIALIGVIFSVVMSLALSRQLSQPVRRLSDAFEQVGQGDLEVRVPDTGSGELGQLAVRFNRMVSDLKRNREALVANQRELNEAQIRMLQAQLNPHFLCNTLDTMKWISKINKVPQVAEMSADLGDILRYSISPDELVPLWRDEEILERYVRIQTVRLSGGFTFLADIPEELADCLVPKLLLQPLVENAILHGIDGVENGGVVVKAREEEGRLVVSVADNGHGLPPELVGPYASQGKPQGHLGLYNVDTILRKYYGEGFGLTLRNRPGGGAEVVAVLPIRREEEDRPC